MRHCPCARWPSRCPVRPCSTRHCAPGTHSAPWSSMPGRPNWSPRCGRTPICCWASLCRPVPCMGCCRAWPAHAWMRRARCNGWWTRPSAWPSTAPWRVPRACPWASTSRSMWVCTVAGSSPQRCWPPCWICCATSRCCRCAASWATTRTWHPFPTCRATASARSPTPGSVTPPWWLWRASDCTPMGATGRSTPLARPRCTCTMTSTRRTSWPWVRQRSSLRTSTCLRWPSWNRRCSSPRPSSR
jgi:hypothetical protein